MSETPPVPPEAPAPADEPEPPARMKAAHVMTLSLPLILIGLCYGAYRLHQWIAVREVFQQISQRSAVVKAEHDRHPDESAAVLDRRYGKALETIDTSHTPRDFAQAFRTWAVSWKLAADLLEQNPNAGQMGKSIGAPVQAAADQLDTLRRKYEF